MENSGCYQKVTTDQHHAMVLLIKELYSQLDEVASMKKQGRPAKLSLYLFQEMCSVLRELEPNLRSLYFELVPKLVGKHRPRIISLSEDAVRLKQPAKAKFINSIRERLAA